MLRRLAPLAALLLVVSPGSAAWSFDVHRYVTGRAIDLLPPAIRPFYQKHRSFVVEHAIDPDLWRNAGFVEEPANHFLDLDGYGPPPFTALPRDYERAVAMHGRETLRKYGLLPWRTAEMYGQLRKAFEEVRAGSSGFALENVQFFSAVVAHYVGDAHVPFHAALNYDGQLTNQHGIHSRFEGELFRRYEQRLTIAPRAQKPVAQPVDFIFDTLITGFGMVEPLLEADRRAVVGLEFYDDKYFDRFLSGGQTILERRLSEAIAGIAAMITGAWEQGGKPDLPLTPSPPVRPIRRP
jgi:hypothetical protein